MRDIELTLQWFPWKVWLRLIHKGRRKPTDIFTKADKTSLYLKGKTTKLSKN